MTAAGIRTRPIDANGLTFMVDEAGEGPDVALLLHGFPESRLSWRHQIEPLAARGWHVLAPDMRGYGESSRPTEQRAYRIDNLVADAAALFDAVGARRRLLLAHDWGAVVAWFFAIRKTRPLDGLVILNVPHPAVFRAVLRRSREQQRRSWYVAFFQVPVLPELLLKAGRARAIGQMFSRMAIDKSAFPPDVLEHYRENAMRPGAMTAMLDYYRANARAFSGRQRYPVIETPTLMIWGEVDVALSLELTEGYDPYVADFTLKRLPRVSHWVQQDAPDAVNATLADWLSRRGIDPLAPPAASTRV